MAQAFNPNAPVDDDDDYVDVEDEVELSDEDNLVINEVNFFWIF